MPYQKHFLQMHYKQIQIEKANINLIIISVHLQLMPHQKHFPLQTKLKTSWLHENTRSNKNQIQIDALYLIYCA